MLALEIIFNILFWPSFVIGCYWYMMFIIGMLFHKQKYPIVEDQGKFVVLVPCHNEEAVIAATIENLAKINYNPDLFDIYFLADNCADQTANEIRKTIDKLEKKNFHVLERNVTDPTKKGKPHAIRWAIDQLESGEGVYGKYDWLMIFDADNFVDADILKHINSQYLSIKPKKRPVMIQTYLDSKNCNNIIARGYWASYRITNGFFALSKSKLGLVPGIGGTGFAIDTKFLQSIGGFNCKSMTEDLEIQTIAVTKGKSIKFNINARIYDEKPTSTKASIVQKTRWMQGHWYCFFKYFFWLFFSLFNLKQIKHIPQKIDQMIHLATGLTILSILPLAIVSIVCFFLHIVLVPTFLIPISIIMSIFSILMMPISSWYDGSKREKKYALLLMIPNYIALLVSSIIYIIAATIGLFKCGNQKVWRKTAHKITTLNPENKGDKSNHDEQN